MKRWVAAAIAALCALTVVQRALAKATDDPATAAALGAAWLDRQINSQGFVAAASGAPAYSNTVDAALALAAAKDRGTSYTNAVNYMKTHVDNYVKDSNGVDQPGALGKLAMLAVSAGQDPTTFGGTNLIQRIRATKRADGLFGAQDPTFDGAFRQSLALLAFAAANAAPPADSVAWLKSQQCTDKGWQSYRADTTQPCTATDVANFAGEDSNSTGIAAQALHALSATFPKGNPLDFLKAMQNTDGGFGYLKGTGTDADSTGLGIQAILALGEDPTAGRWVLAGGTPMTALLALQVASPDADRGAFDFQQENPLKPNFLATVQAVPAAARQPFPIPPPPPPTPTTTTTVAVTTTTVATTSTTLESSTVKANAANAPTAGVATPVVATPRLTG